MERRRLEGILLRSRGAIMSRDSACRRSASLRARLRGFLYYSRRKQQ